MSKIKAQFFTEKNKFNKFKLLRFPYLHMGARTRTTRASVEVACQNT